MRFDRAGRKIVLVGHVGHEEIEGTAGQPLPVHGQIHEHLAHVLVARFAALFQRPLDDRHELRREVGVDVVQRLRHLQQRGVAEVEAVEQPVADGLEVLEQSGGDAEVVRGDDSALRPPDGP